MASVLHFNSQFCNWQERPLRYRHHLHHLFRRIVLACMSLVQRRREKLSYRCLVCSAVDEIGTLRSNDADDYENVKKTIGSAKLQLRTCITLFCTFLSRFCTVNYDVKMPNFAFYEGRKQATTKFYFSF